MKEYPGPGPVRLGGLAALLLSAGCVSTALQVPEGHPARGDSPAGQTEQQPGALLRPEAPLYPSGLADAGRMARPVGKSEAPDGSRQAPYVGQGVIREVAEGELRIQHGPIPGFMGAMTMPFALADEAMTGPWEAGDRILFRIERDPDQGFRIFSIDRMEGETEGAPAGHGHPDPASSEIRD